MEGFPHSMYFASASWVVKEAPLLPRMLSKPKRLAQKSNKGWDVAEAFQCSVSVYGALGLISNTTQTRDAGACL